MRLIDADALGIGLAKPEVFENPAYAEGWNAAVTLMQTAPAVDAVPVVRCKDCFHAYRKDDKLWCVFCGNCIVPEDDYCFYGVRDNRTDDRPKDYYAISQAMGFSTR